MAFESDHIVDRRRIRRKLTFWRAAAIMVAIGSIIATALAFGGRGMIEAGTAAPQIARVTIQGLIRGDQERVESLSALAKAGSVRAVIVHIDSPGGTTAGSEQLYQALRGVAAKKPIVIVVDGLAASGGYIAALSADHIIAQETSLVGSIGVLFQYPNVTELLKTVGVKVEEIKSSPLKAAPNGFEPTSPEARAAIESIVKDTYAWFRGLVHERRKIDGEALDKVTDGRVFTGRQSASLKLIDEIGNEKTAVEWLSKTHGISLDTPVRDWRLRSRLSDLSFLHMGTAAILEMLGLFFLARQLEESGTVQAIEKLSLDGLLALWHPSSVN